MKSTPEPPLIFARHILIAVSLTSSNHTMIQLDQINHPSRLPAQVSLLTRQQRISRVKPLNHTAAKSKQATKVKNASLDSVCDCLHYPNSSLDNNPNCRNQFSQQNDIDYLKLHYETRNSQCISDKNSIQDTKHDKNNVVDKTCKIVDENPFVRNSVFSYFVFLCT